PASAGKAERRSSVGVNRMLTMAEESTWFRSSIWPRRRSVAVSTASRPSSSTVTAPRAARSIGVLMTDQATASSDPATGPPAPGPPSHPRPGAELQAGGAEQFPNLLRLELPDLARGQLPQPDRTDPEPDQAADGQAHPGQQS